MKEIPRIEELVIKCKNIHRKSFFFLQITENQQTIKDTESMLIEKEKELQAAVGSEEEKKLKKEIHTLKKKKKDYLLVIDKLKDEISIKSFL
jgi:hypothetical protein